MSLNVTVRGIDAAADGTPFVLTPYYLSASDNSTTNPVTDPNLFLYSFATPPAHGVIKLDGVTATQFTQQQVNDGRVAYVSTDGITDSIQYFLRTTTTAGVAKPYTPTMTMDSDTMPSNDGGIYLATAMVGAVAPPTFRVLGGFQGSSGTSNTHSATFDLLAGDVVVINAWATPLSAPYANVTSIIASGLTLTHIGGGKVTTAAASNPTIYNTAEWYWAPVGSNMTTTVTVTFDKTFARSLMEISFWAFQGAASLTSPWDTNASNLVSTTATTLPPTLYLTTDAPDEHVLPVFYEIVSGDEIGGLAYTDVKGYHNIGTSSGTLGVNFAYERFTPVVTMGVTVSGPAPSPSASLAMDNLLVSGGPKTSELIFLLWSDDRGHTWSNPVGQKIGERGAYLTSVNWSRLGYARDRVWALEWSVPVKTALQGAWIDADTSAKS